ncbi:MAG TPA: GxxExxY protein [Kofleriaceae bacterium]|nr:GxxExxY protein [Kofleriaceae bacterium]
MARARSASPCGHRRGHRGASTTGPGFLEHVYEAAMTIELTARRIPFQRQVTFPIYYKDVLVAESRLDLLVAEQLVVELKAVEELRPIHTAQVLSYLRTGEFQLGLLFNFNVYSLRQAIQRIVWTG